MMLRRTLLLATIAIPNTASAQSSGEDVVRVLLEPGSVGLLRHASAPGFGDPPGFRLGDCATQRNLDEPGREQARRVGIRLRAAGAVPAVFSSEWCRTQETASLLGLGPARPFPALNSFFANSATAAAQTNAVRRFVAAWSGSPLLLVTHQVNITALTGIVPTDSELVILRPGASGLQVAARVAAGRP